MKFRLLNAMDSTIDSEIEVNTIEDLIKIIDNINDSQWCSKAIIVSESFSDKYKYEITIYNTYVE